MESSGFLEATVQSASRRGESAHVDTGDRREAQPMTARTNDAIAFMSSNGIVAWGLKSQTVWKNVISNNIIRMITCNLFV